MRKIARMKISKQLYTLEMLNLMPKMLIVDVSWEAWNEYYIIVFECDLLKEIKDGEIIPQVQAIFMGETDLFSKQVICRFDRFEYDEKIHYEREYKLDKKEVKECQTFLMKMQKLWKKLLRKK